MTVCFFMVRSLLQSVVQREQIRAFKMDKSHPSSQVCMAICSQPVLYVYYLYKKTVRQIKKTKDCSTF